MWAGTLLVEVGLRFPNKSVLRAIMLRYSLICKQCFEDMIVVATDNMHDFVMHEMHNYTVSLCLLRLNPRLPSRLKDSVDPRPAEQAILGQRHASTTFVVVFGFHNL